MTGKKWGVTATAAFLILALLGTGFTAMSTNPPFTVPEWVPYIFFVLAVLIAIVLIIWIMKRPSHIKQVVGGLLSNGIYTDRPDNILRILYHDRDVLSRGMIDYNLTPMMEVVLARLSQRNIVQLEQRKEQIYGSNEVKDRGYWVLTELGRAVIAYTEKHPQILHREGSVSK